MLAARGPTWLKSRTPLVKSTRNHVKFPPKSCGNQDQKSEIKPLEWSAAAGTVGARAAGAGRARLRMRAWAMRAGCLGHVIIYVSWPRSTVHYSQLASDYARLASRSRRSESELALALTLK